MCMDFKTKWNMNMPSSSPRDIQEVDREHSPPLSPGNHDYIDYVGEDTEDAAFHDAASPVDIFLYNSIDTAASDQRTSTMSPLPCDCTEVLSVRSTETSCLGAARSYELSPIPKPHNSGRPYAVQNPNNWQTPEPQQLRRRIRFAPSMAPPSNRAQQVANRVIKYARGVRNVHERELCCLNCGSLPTNPVTNACGHTRCTDCASKGSCPCGNHSTDAFYVNILIRDLIAKTADKHALSAPIENNCPDLRRPSVSGRCSSARTSAGPMRPRRRASRCISSRNCPPCPMSPRARYNYAVDLVLQGRHREAAPHLALSAASAHPDLQPARRILAQVVSILSEDRDPRYLTRQLNRLVRRISSTSWLKQSDMECILCCDTFIDPVTTPCGHMFCRTCIERTLDYNKRCPLCLRPLIDFNLRETRNTSFIQAALKSINAVVMPPPQEPDLIPIFVCTVAFPSVPCPLFIFDPRYWLMIRRVLESGSRKFGMVVCDRGQAYANYGTILEVRDCVHLEDGRSILSTVGLSRFKVIERGVRDGCEVARILPITDVKPVDIMEIWELKVLASQVMCKALLWISQLDKKVVKDIVTAFGNLEDQEERDERWWTTADGPSWLW